MLVPFKIPVQGTEPYTFNNCNPKVYRDVGELIWTAAQNPDNFEAFRRVAAKRLTDVGVLSSAIDNRYVLAVKDDPTLVHIPVPEVKTREELGDAFDIYLFELGLVTLRACKRG